MTIVQREWVVPTAQARGRIERQCVWVQLSSERPEFGDVLGDPTVPDEWLVLEDLLETRPGPDATSIYRDADDLAWSMRWPSECLWRVRKR